MLRASSVAVVGASSRPGSVGDQTLRQLIGGGFDGAIYPVNPRYRTLSGLECVPSIGHVGDTVDLAVLAVPNSQLEQEMERAVEAGVRSVAIFASCHGVASDGSSLKDRIRSIADSADIPICGGNGMGFVNLEADLRVCGFYQRPDLMPGGISFLSHSGSLFSAMLHNRRGLRFNLVVSTGLELNTTVDQYLQWVIDLESTKVVALFLEAIRNPQGFRSALMDAESRGIPVVALKVGVETSTRAAVATHSEAIAGDDAAYEALFDAHGVHRVRSMDELADTIEIFSNGRRATAPGLGLVHDSGGERALTLDTAGRVGVSIPTVGEATKSRLAAVLDEGLEPANPVDAWGTGRGFEDVFVECLEALATDPVIGAVVFAVDLTEEETPEETYGRSALTMLGRTQKPVAVLSNMASTVDPGQAKPLREGGVPVLEGTETGMLAIRHLFDDHMRRSLPPPAERLTEPGNPYVGVDGEISALRVLSSYGIAVPTMTVASSESQAVDQADRMGYPVVLKTTGLAHKSAADGVIVDVRDERALRAGYSDLAERLGNEVIVAEMIDPGVELALGMITDRQFGPVVLLGAGGTLIEVLHDRVAVLPSIDVARATRVVDRLGVRPLLDPMGADVNVIADVLARFSELAVDCVDVVASIDVNPLIVSRGRAVAVDALFEVL